MSNADAPQPNEEGHRAFIRLFARHEGALRGFVRSLLPSWDDVDEVMQEVSIVAWTKFNQFDRQSDFGLWTASIARFEVLNYRRTKARDRLVFDETLLQIIAEEGVRDFERSEATRRALESCLDQLDSSQRSLLLRVHGGGQKIKSIAEEMGTTPNALYKTVDRLRVSLLRCMQRRLNQHSTEGASQ